MQQIQGNTKKENHCCILRTEYHIHYFGSILVKWEFIKHHIARNPKNFVSKSTNSIHNEEFFCLGIHEKNCNDI